MRTGSYDINSHIGGTAALIQNQSFASGASGGGSNTQLKKKQALPNNSSN